MENKTDADLSHLEGELPPSSSSLTELPTVLSLPDWACPLYLFSTTDKIANLCLMDFWHSPLHSISFFSAVEAFDGLRIWSTFSFRMEQHAQFRASTADALWVLANGNCGAKCHKYDRGCKAWVAVVGWLRTASYRDAAPYQQVYLIIFKQAALDVCQFLAALGRGKQQNPLLWLLGQLWSCSATPSAASCAVG